MTSADSPSPPCQQSRLDAYVTLSASNAEVAVAKKICRACPLRRDCALEALHAGDLLDGSWTSPANDVVQAGVECRGDERTAESLARVAGVPVPAYSDKPRRAVPAEVCVNCHRPLYKWTRHPEDIPAGYVQHHARNHCVHCRTAYRRLIDQEGRRPQGLRKEIDRKRHHRKPLSDAQLDQWLREWLPHHSPATPTEVRAAALAADMRVTKTRLGRAVESLGGRVFKFERSTGQLTPTGRPQRQTITMWTMPSPRPVTPCPWEDQGVNVTYSSPNTKRVRTGKRVNRTVRKRRHRPVKRVFSYS